MAGGDRFRERPGGARTRFDRGGAEGKRAGPTGYVGDVSPGGRIAALSGVALALLMLLDWFGGRNAWQLDLVDLLLLGIVAFAVGLAARRATSRGPVATESAGLALTVAGGVAVGVMLTLVLESSGGTVPLVLSLAAAGGILGGGLVEMGASRDRAVPRREPRS